MTTRKTEQFHKCANVACERENGRIVPGETIAIIGRDNLGRDKVICLTCKKGQVMTVKDLIEFLQKQPQDIRISYSCCSEQVLMKLEEIEIVDLCIARPDGWVQDYRAYKVK